MVRNIRRDEQEGIVIPYPKMTETEDGRGMLLELLSTGGARQFDTNEIINRYEKRMAMSVLAQWVFLGMESVGTQALATVQGDFFTLALDGWAKVITDTINRHAVPRLFDLNTFDIEEVPRWRHSRVGTPDLATISEYINQLVGVNVITPDDELERHLRQIARFPDAPEKEVEVDADDKPARLGRETVEVQRLSLLLQQVQRVSQDLLEAGQIDQATADEMVKPTFEALRTTGIIGKQYSVPEKVSKVEIINGGKAEAADSAANQLRDDLKNAYTEWLEETADELEGERDPTRRREILAGALGFLVSRVRSLTQIELMDLALKLAVSDVGLKEMEGITAETLRMFEEETVPALSQKLEETVPEEVVERNAGFWTRVALVGGILWTAYQGAKFAGRTDDPMVQWVGPTQGACDPCLAEMRAGARPLSQTPLPGADVCLGLTQCRHDLEEAS